VLGITDVSAFCIGPSVGSGGASEGVSEDERCLIGLKDEKHGLGALKTVEPIAKLIMRVWYTLPHFDGFREKRRF
jgi:hypothetical protein